MTTAKEYREYADECLGWAKKAKTDQERRDFLQMAEAWLQAAALLDPMRGVSNRGTPASPEVHLGGGGE